MLILAMGAYLLMQNIKTVFDNTICLVLDNNRVVPENRIRVRDQASTFAKKLDVK